MSHAIALNFVDGVTPFVQTRPVDTLAAYAVGVDAFTFTTCVATQGSDHPRKGYVTDHLAPEALNGGDVDINLPVWPASDGRCGQPCAAAAGRDTGQLLLRDVCLQRHGRSRAADGVRRP